MPDGKLALSWHNAPDADFSVTVVVRYDGAPDGKPVGPQPPKVGDAFGAGVVQYVGGADSFIDTSLRVAPRAARSHWRRSARSTVTETLALAMCHTSGRMHYHTATRRGRPSPMNACSEAR